MRGTTFPDEFILFDSHYDGQNNQGVRQMKGNLGTQSVYDNLVAVAAGLTMAEEFARYSCAWCVSSAIFANNFDYQ